jgi:hypothetical protein
MISVGRVFLTLLKIFLLLVVAAMVRFQIPELSYDFGTREPVSIESKDELSLERFPRSTFASVQGKADFTKAATFSKHSVRYTYFLLEEYGVKLVVRTPEVLSEEWTQIDFHVGRLRPYNRMPFSRSVRAGFRELFDLGIPEDAFFLARDDVPKPNGWSIGAISFASILWFVLVYFFFIHSHIFKNQSKMDKSLGLGNLTSAHHTQPEPAGNQPGNDSTGADQDSK